MGWGLNIAGRNSMYRGNKKAETGELVSAFLLSYALAWPSRSHLDVVSCSRSRTNPTGR